MIQTHDTEHETGDCELCGADRPRDPQRLIVTFQDRSDGTIQDERVFLCENCWGVARSRLRRRLK